MSYERKMWFCRHKLLWRASHSSLCRLLVGNIIVQTHWARIYLLWKHLCCNIFLILWPIERQLIARRNGNYLWISSFLSQDVNILEQKTCKPKLKTIEINCISTNASPFNSLIDLAEVIVSQLAAADCCDLLRQVEGDSINKCFSHFLQFYTQK